MVCIERHPERLADTDGRVLFMQVTTAGDISGTVNVQIFVNGDGSNDVRNSFDFDGAGTYGIGLYNACGCTDEEAFNYDPDAEYDDGSCEAVAEGCTDEAACNYDSSANTNDGSCEFPDAGYDCDGNCLSDTDGDGVAMNLKSKGAPLQMRVTITLTQPMTMAAVRYSRAQDVSMRRRATTIRRRPLTIHSGANTQMPATTATATAWRMQMATAYVDEFEIAGCQDAEACNYNADATDSDDSCEYAEEGYNCDGNCLNDADGDGVCDEFEVAGCTDASACNYNADATDEDGSCTYSWRRLRLRRQLLADADGDGVCDEFGNCGLPGRNSV